MDRFEIGKRVVAVLAAVALGGWSTVGASASPRQESAQLPPVSLSSTTFHDGDTITMSGTGCIDPATGSGEGLVAVLYRARDQGRGGLNLVLSTIEAEVEADGAFRGTGTIAQPLLPPGRQQAAVSCERPGPADQPAQSVLHRMVDIDIVAPSLPDLTVSAGSALDYVLPCDIEGGEYGSFAFRLTAEGKPDVVFSAAGSYPTETSPNEGDHVELDVPADALPGTYAATASCSVSESGAYARWSGFTVTVERSGSATTTSVAVGVAPIAGSPNYTG